MNFPPQHSQVFDSNSGCQCKVIFLSYAVVFYSFYFYLFTCSESAVPFALSFSEASVTLGLLYFVCKCHVKHRKGEV